MIKLPAIIVDGIKCCDSSLIPDDVVRMELNGNEWTIYQAGDTLTEGQDASGT